MERIIPQFSKEFFLAAGQCNAEGMLPLQWLVQRLIDVATLHANSIDIGYSHLRKYGASWVLHYVVIEMESYPHVNEKFTIETWIVKTGPLTSDRGYRIINHSGDVVGYALTTWVAINIGKRTAMRLDRIFADGLPDTGVYPPVERFRKIQNIAGGEHLMKYKFCYTDLDCNRHVTTRRYVELMLNSLSLDCLDEHIISRLELSFHSEALFGEEADVINRPVSALSREVELKCGDRLLCAFRINLKRI